jgi:zinc/manganese transport system substrate-binding protein
VTPLAEGLGLKLATPESFLDAVSEGTDPTAADKITADRQITTKQIKIFVFNSQNSTPDVTALMTAAKAAGIPVQQ